MEDPRRLERRSTGSDSTFGDGRPDWLGRLGNVRNVVRQEMISRQLDKHLRMPSARVLDVGAGQGTQSIRLARAGDRPLAALLDTEERLGSSDPYRQLGQLAYLILRKDNGPTRSSPALVSEADGHPR
jgi:hypothetical protein